MHKIIKSTDKNYVEISADILHETYPGEPDKGAYLVTDTGDKKDKQWVSKNLIEEDNPIIEKGIITFTIPEWLALQKGFV